MKLVDEINGRGWANGWHAQELQKEAQRTGQTMVECFNRKIAGASAFNVPAECVKADSQWIYYEFADGSKAQFVNCRKS